MPWQVQGIGGEHLDGDNQLRDRKRRQDIARMIALAKLEMVSLEMTRGTHISLTLRAQDGREKLFTLSATPGDWRSDLNTLARFKRFARDAPKPEVDRRGR